MVLGGSGSIRFVEGGHGCRLIRMIGAQSAEDDRAERTSASSVGATRRAVHDRRGSRVV